MQHSFKGESVAKGLCGHFSLYWVCVSQGRTQAWERPRHGLGSQWCYGCWGFGA